MGQPCPGCGWVGGTGGACPHPYIGASAACWDLYGELLALRAGGSRVAVDAYAVQHPGRSERRSVQSVGVHAMVLCLVFERGMRPEDATEATRRILARPPALRWLEPPASPRWMTVADVLAAGAEPDAVERWAASVWEAWAAHHATIRDWVGQVFGDAPGPGLKP